MFRSSPCLSFSLAPPSPSAGAGGDAVLEPRAAAIAADADPSVAPAERQRLWHVADVEALEYHKTKAKATVKYGGVFVRASVADDSRLPLDGIPMTRDGAGHYKMHGYIFGLHIGDSRGSVKSISRSASAKTGFPDIGSSFSCELCIKDRDVAVTFTVTGAFGQG